MLVKLKENYKFLYSLIAGVLYFGINFKYLFSFTAPSDPLQYVLPSLYPENGFEFLDRIVLWLWIRLVANFPIEPEYIGGVATLLLTSFTLVIGSIYLSKKVNFIASSVFVFLYTFTPSILSVASYTYPMQLLTFLLLLTVISIDYAKDVKKMLFIFGFGFIFIIFSKIQGYSFGLFILIYIIYISKTLKQLTVNTAYLFFGIISALVIIFGIIYILDGYDTLFNLFSNYFENIVSKQYNGRHLEGFPPFYSYLLEPTALLSLIGILLGLSKKYFSKVGLFSLIGMSQLSGILFIYLISSRGGTVIENYTIDSYTFGLFAVSGIIGVVFHDKWKIASALFIGTPLILIILCISLNSGSHVYNPIYNILISYNSVIGYVALLIIILVIYLLFFNDKSKYSYPMVLLLFLLVLLKSHLGIQASKFLRNYNLPFHQISKEINKLKNNDGLAWVTFKINNSSVAQSTQSLRTIYRSFYNLKSNLIFSDVEPTNYTRIITNRLDLITKNLEFGNNILNKKSNYTLEKKIKATQLNKVHNFFTKLSILRGDFYISTRDQGMIIEPMKNSDSFIAQFNYNISNVKKNIIKLQFSKHIFIPSGYRVNLYMQYEENGTLHRQNIDLQSEKLNYLFMIIPSQATKISCGIKINAINVSKSMFIPSINITNMELDNKKVFSVIEKKL